jgi:diguanylate cyclase (GGDEF)-like protein
MLCYPIAVFAAIFRYHLFDIALVVRRSLVYTTLTTSLLLVFYSALGAGGALSSRLFGTERNSIWVVSAATLVLGMLFSPLRRLIQGFIDRRIYPRRLELRQRFTRIASELPSLGRLQLMGDHLVTELSLSFAVRPVHLLLSDPASEVLVPLASLADADEVVRGRLLLSSDDPTLRQVFKGNRPVRVAELGKMQSELARRLHSADAKVLVPLRTQNTDVGLLLLGENDDHQPLRSEEFELLTLLSHHVASVFENVRLFQSATYEGLTGLYRREAIVDLLGREITRAQRYDRPLTIGLADIDHFKQVNDRHGHIAGDLVLRHIADQLQSWLRSTDLVGRYGGEEFLLIFPETRLDVAEGLAEKLRERIETSAIKLDNSVVVERLTISIGISALTFEDHANGDASHSLLNRADQALYRAKKLGRNRVEALIPEASDLTKEEVSDNS